MPTADACKEAAAAQQACGFLFISAFNNGSIGSCNAAAKSCCLLNPYLGCSAGASGSFTPRFGQATLGIFGQVDARS